MEELPEIERSVEIPADPDEVWKRIVDGDLAEEWMGVRIEPRRGGAVTVPDREVIGTVEEVAPGESITWSWRELDGDPSQVTIDLTPTEEGTRVTIVERLLEYQITGLPPVLLRKAA
jgi:uncharacterized protein YndB with AHSA1/START domain